MQKDYYDVAIATPGSYFESTYLQSLIKTIERLVELGISYKFVNGTSSIVAVARERCLFPDLFNSGIGQDVFGGEFDCKKIFWIDSDMKWEPEDFLKLLHSDKDIISGTCLMGDNTQVPIFPRIGFSPLIKGAVMALPNIPHKIEACGMGFLAVSMSAMNRIEKPWFGDIKINLEENSGNVVEWFCNSEDIAFCQRAKIAGVEVWFDPSVRVGHVKKRLLTL